MNSFSGIEIGKRALMAQNSSINTAGHNISCADIEGYSRQRVETAAFDAISRPDLARANVPGQIGQGISVERITRLRDDLLETRIASQASGESYWETREKYMAMLEQVYNEPNDVSLRTTMDKFWQSWQELSLSPESNAVRQAVVTRGETLASSVRMRYDQFDSIEKQIDGDIEATVRQINSLSARVAQLNGEIVRSRAMGDEPNDILDKRDLLVSKLAKLANVATSIRDDDEFMVHIDGKILVQGEKFRTFQTDVNPEFAGRLDVFWADNGRAAKIEGGQLGALVELRDSDIRAEKQGLNSLAMNFVDLVNDVHRNAIGANNVTGLDFFVERPFVANAQGNFDRSGDGEFDSTYAFRMTGANSLNPAQQVGFSGQITISGKQGNISVPYNATDTVREIVERINNFDGEVKAYLDAQSRLVLKATAADDARNPDFVIRHVEDSSHFLAGFAGLLAQAGEGGAYDFAQADATAALRADSQFSVAPVLNPAASVAVPESTSRDVLSVAAGFPNSDGVREVSDGRAALAIASIRNNPVMIGAARTFDDYFAESVTNIGLKAEQAEVSLQSAQAVMDDLRAMRDAISGVNIDEELADIIKFQHGYNAAAKFVSVIDELLETVINRMRA